MARILTIDDSDHIRQLLAITLRLKKHEVVEAVNGQDGLDKLTEGVFDLVICDIDMPVMNGLEFLAAARDRGAGQTPPCLILTAEPHDTRERALALGAVGVLVKPFAPLALYGEIAKHLPGLNRFVLTAPPAKVAEWLRRGWFRRTWSSVS